MKLNQKMKELVSDINSGKKPYELNAGVFDFLWGLWKDIPNPKNADKNLPSMIEYWERNASNGWNHVPDSPKIIKSMIEKGVTPQDIATLMMESQIDGYYRVFSLMTHGPDDLRSWNRCFRICEVEIDPETYKETVISDTRIEEELTEYLQEAKPDDYPDMPRWV